MTEVVQEKPAKKVVERVTVEMADGRKVEFAGKKQMLKEVLLDRENGKVALRIDFRNGETRTFEPHDDLILEFIGHGMSQKYGDEAAGETDVDDMVVALDAIHERLADAKWSGREGTGDGFSGASVVIRAIMEATEKDQATVKAFLQKKLDTAAAKGEKLTRQDLYKSFRNPGSKTGQIILRMEQEKAAKGNKLDADDLLGEIE